jgi:hypothetical protein
LLDSTLADPVGAARLLDSTLADPVGAARLLIGYQAINFFPDVFN